MTRHRITTSRRSFDIERFAGLDKKGEETWHKLAYFRTVKGVRGYLATHKLPLSLADHLPIVHADVYHAAMQHVGQVVEREAGAAKRSEIARKSALARRARSTRTSDPAL